jgi:hypothetical protein
MKDLTELIHTKRPNLANSSVKTYVNSIKNLFNYIFPKDDFNYKLFFADYKKVLQYLESCNLNSRKTYLSALVVLSEGEKADVINAYRDQMLKDSEQARAIEKTNKMSDKMKEAWISWQEIIDILNDLKERTYWIFKAKKPTKDEILELQKFIILSCYTMIPPRRAKDFVEMKVKDYDEKDDNYYLKGTFHFNSYKTSGTYGKQSEKIPKSLEMLLAKWIKFHDKDYLFTDYYDKKLTSSGLTKILNSVFDKNISVSMIRHIFITYKLGDKIQELEDIAGKMSHSTAEQKLYVKVA